MSEDERTKLSGMTVNERLFHVGTIDQWDAAIRRKDRPTMIRLLAEVEVASPEKTVDVILAHPERYGC
jgi:hypothetical protein